MDVKSKQDAKALWPMMSAEFLGGCVVLLVALAGFIVFLTYLFREPSSFDVTCFVGFSILLVAAIAYLIPMIVALCRARKSNLTLGFSFGNEEVAVTRYRDETPQGKTVYPYGAIRSIRLRGGYYYLTVSGRFPFCIDASAVSPELRELLARLSLRRR